MKEKILSFSKISIGVVSFGLIVFVSIKYLFPIILPFVIALICASAADSPARRWSEKMKIPSRVLRLMLSLFLILAIAILIGFIVWQATGFVLSFLKGLGEGNAVYDMISSLISPSESLFGIVFPEELALKIKEALGTLLSSFVTKLAEIVTKVISAVPEALFFLIVTLISVVYFALDYEGIEKFFSKILKKQRFDRVKQLRDGIISAIGKYLASYSLLLLMTFGIVLLGFILLGVKRAPRIAVLVAILDLLPIIGVGTVLIPWGIFELATGNLILGVGLIVLFAVNAFLRQLAEPKILGKSLNLHPIIMLMLIYIGFALFGVSGILILPLIAVGLLISLKNKSAAEID